MTKFHHLKLKNFLSYKSLDINLDDIVYTSVVGENGAGKSAIPQAIVWILYGSSRFGSSADSIVNDTAQTATGELTLTDRHGQSWKIERSWTIGKGKGGGLAIFSKDAESGEWKQFSDKLQKTAQKQISEIIGLTENAFYSLVVMDQSKYPGGTAFTATNSNMRREILMGLVPELAVWKELEIAARARSKEAVKEHEAFQSKIDLNVAQMEKAKEREDSIKLLMDDYDVPSISKERAEAEKRIASLQRSIGAAGSSEEGAIKSRIQTAEAEHNLAVNKLDSEAQELDNRLSANDEAKLKVKNALKRDRELKSSLSELREREEEVSDELSEEMSIVTSSQEAVERIEPKLEAARGRRSELNSKIAEADERIDALGETHDSGSCWVCGSEISEEQHASILRGVVDERDALNSSLSENDEELNALQSRLSSAKRDLREAAEGVSNLKSELASTRTSIQSTERGIEEAENDASKLESSVLSEVEEQELTKKISDLDDTIEALRLEFKTNTIRILRDELAAVQESSNTDGLTAELNDLERELSVINDKQSKVERLSASLEEAQRSTAEFNKENKRLNREGLEVKERAARLQKLVHATSPKGIPSILLDSILSEIEAEQNIILSSLSGTNQMTVEFTQERENKGGGSQEVLDILVHTADGSIRLYESFSFGERVRLSISNLFAMIKVFNQRSGGMVNTLFLDEPLGPLDKSKIPAFIDILRIVMNQGLVDSIFVITHDDRVVEALPQKIMVSIDPETKESSLEVI